MTVDMLLMPTIESLETGEIRVLGCASGGLDFIDLPLTEEERTKLALSSQVIKDKTTEYG